MKCDEIDFRNTFREMVFIQTKYLFTHDKFKRIPKYWEIY